ncbi:MAG: hypothetical protein ABIF77_01070 [bacterium]
MRIRPSGAGSTFLAVAFAATATKLLLIWRGLPETSLIADDAYYYFTIARNLAEGLGPTFDGLASSNGFHPLWQFLLVPLFRFGGDDLWTPGASRPEPNDGVRPLQRLVHLPAGGVVAFTLAHDLRRDSGCGHGPVVRLVFRSVRQSGASFGTGEAPQ